MLRLARSFFVGLLLSLFCFPTHLSFASPSSTSTLLPGHVLPALAKATPVSKSAAQSRKDTAARITLTVVLKRDDQAGFERYLRDVYDRHSPRFHHFLTQSQIADRFGPSHARYAAVLAYMRARGFKLTQGSANRLTLTVRGTRGMAERTLDVRIRDYRLGKRTFYANEQNPALPMALAEAVQSVDGLANLARPQAETKAIKWVIGNTICSIDFDGSPPCQPGQTQCFLAVKPANCPFCSPNAMQPYTKSDCLAAVKNAVESDAPITVQFGGQAAFPTCVPNGSPCPPGQCTPLSNGFCDPPPPAFQSPLLSDLKKIRSPSGAATSATAGSGQKIGLVEFDGFHMSDVSDYLSLQGYSSSELSNLSVVSVNGGIATPGASQDEVLLDIDTTMDVAPGAKTVVYEAPFAGAGASFQPILNQMISDGVTIISNSWAYCEDQTTAADAQSIDTIFQQAAASGISVFNGSGDSGSTCLDGSPNVIGVPADSPNATAVGGSSAIPGPGGTYGSETWWDDSQTSPPAGQGGFGVSAFFTAPAYQTGLAAKRSIPDVVANADPFQGVAICEASAGGCPTDQLFGGTSFSAPLWAAYTALINQSLGRNVGFLNPLLYPLGGSNAFHDATSMSSDFAHVGLGSPNIDNIILGLSGQAVGMPSAANSFVSRAFDVSPLNPIQILGVSADGDSSGLINVTLVDSNLNPVSGKTVTLAPNGGANVDITPPSAMTDGNGVASFEITDETAEPVTFTATDMTDGIVLSRTAVMPFLTPPATSASIVASLNTDPADGTTADTITVTVKDSLGRPTPGKVVTLSQNGGNSAIGATSPAVTDNNGQIAFSVTDLVTETVTYTATDVTDGNLAVPGNAQVDFTNGPGGCGAGLLRGGADPADGYQVSTFASGFFVSAGNQGFSYNCIGAYGMAWDAAANMYVTDWPTGKVYKFGPSGGVADPGHLFTTVQAPATGAAIDPAGNMFVGEGSVSGPLGDIVPVNLSTGTVGAAIASGIECLSSLALDPTSPSLFALDFCNIGQGGSNNIWKVTGIDGVSPTTAVFAQVPDTNLENLQLAVAPDGTLYDVFGAGGAGAPIARIATNGTVTTLTEADSTPVNLTGGLGFTLGGKQASGDAQFAIAPFNSKADSEMGFGAGVRTLDLTGASPAPGVPLTTTDFSGLSNFAIGPDGCLYVAGGPTVSRVTNNDGSCSFGPVTQPPTISLSPAVVMPNPTQGASQNFTATLHYATTLSGVPMTLQTSGVNPQFQFATTDASGQAAFNYTGAHPGSDMASALSLIAGDSVVSNPSLVTWDAGQDLTFLTLAKSPAASLKIQQVTLSANLSDVSMNPVKPVVGQTINFSLGGDQNCMGTTNAKGDASCQVTSAILGTATLTATFAGTVQLASSSASEGFMGIGPVIGKLKISPKALNFGNVKVGQIKTKSLKITNLGKITKKKNALPITVVMQSVNNAAYQVQQPECVETLNPKSKGVKAGSCTVKVVFTPMEVMKFPATLTVIDNLEPNEMQAVPVKGAGK